MAYTVLLTKHAALDLESIYNYVFDYDSPKKADYVMTQIKTTLSKLVELPERGTFPKELAALGIQEFREIFFKSCSIIYRIIGKKIYVLFIADGRRDMCTLLQKRLLAPDTA